MMTGKLLKGVTKGLSKASGRGAGVPNRGLLGAASAIRRGLADKKSGIFRATPASKMKSGGKVSASGKGKKK